MMGPDCQYPYIDGISIVNQAPYRINAIANYIVGWKDPVCIICENKDEKVDVRITIDQLPCKDSNNCPANGTTGEEHGSGSCKGFLDHVANPKDMVFTYSSSGTPVVFNESVQSYFVN